MAIHLSTSRPRRNVSAEFAGARTRLQSVVLLIVGIAAVFPVPAACGATQQHAAATSDDLKQQVVALINRLDADSFQTRRSAERELLQLGTKVLPLLPPSESAPSISVREAVKRLRLRLEYRKARESVRAARITVEKSQSLSKLLQEITTQTGNQIDVTGLTKGFLQQRITVRYQQRTFWSAMDDLSARAKFRYADNATNGSLKLEPFSKQSASAPIAVTYSGPFRIAVHAVGLKPLRGDENHQLLRTSFGVTAEPRLRPLFVKYSGRDVTVLTKRGVLESFSPEAQYELPLGEAGKSVTLHANFKVPSSADFTETTLRGRMTVQTAAGSEHFEFSNLSQSPRQSRQRGGVTVLLKNATFQSVQDGTQKATFQIAVSYETGGPAFESHRTWIYHNRVYLETKSGTRIERSKSFSTELQADGGVIVGYTFENLKNDAAAYKFVYVAPTLILNVPVEFEIKNISVSGF